MGVARLVSVFDNAEYYMDPEYGVTDSMTDLIDPTRFVRNTLEGEATWWLGAPTNDTDYGNLKTSTPDISFPEFTLD